MPGEFETIVRAILTEPSEDRSVEFKGPSDWESIKAKVLKGALALANLVGDGYFIVGVDEIDDKPVLTGISQEQAATFNADNILDFLGKYMEPPVEMRPGIIEFSDKLFFALEVKYSDRRPVKAKKGFLPGEKDEVLAYQIHYRPKGVRPQSRKAEAGDIEDLIQGLIEAGVRDFGRKFSIAFPHLFEPQEGSLTQPAPEDNFKKERDQF